MEGRGPKKEGEKGERDRQIKGEGGERERERERGWLDCPKQSTVIS